MNRGFFVGLWLTAWRILRCNPFSAGGYDPVPQKKIPKYRRQSTDGSDTTNESNNDNTPAK